MKHFFVFVGLVFLGVAFYWGFKSYDNRENARPVLVVYASSSFVSQWGPGPWLKTEFEKNCDCVVEFHEALDTYLLIQKIRSDLGGRGVDLVLSLDTLDLEIAEKQLTWKELQGDWRSWDEGLEGGKSRFFLPYNYSALAFVYRTSDGISKPTSIQDLTLPQFKDQFVLIDPRSSSLGLQFVNWVYQAYGEDMARTLLQQIHQNVKLLAANWSSAYGMFREKQVAMALSYITSPFYHRIEEKSNDIQAILFREGHPLFIEYLGIPEVCENCELAQQFITFLLGDVGQKIIMEKNYMLPIRKKVREGTVFADVPPFHLLKSKYPEKGREFLLSLWVQSRKAQ
ncbi:MAG: thiamine ABC transporter substrate-binding protein [Bdellovibrionaceae bacterium]|nr:thiamine ABC transporter substrate-binding protein [Pseudobdellovibrionaceae bacterium]MDW8189777.1 thiamine ABC transporter substrate-binding protein [Pseudobdellovibrionaceae bacterium]